MADHIRLNRPYYPPFIPSTSKKTGQFAVSEGGSFAERLQDSSASQPLQFSQHALNRMQARGIELSAEQMHCLQGAVDKVASKGGKETLVIMKNTAFIVSTKNKTVITAIDEQSLKDHVFTQIDSTILI